MAPEKEKDQAPALDLPPKVALKAKIEELEKNLRDLQLKAKIMAGKAAVRSAANAEALKQEHGELKDKLKSLEEALSARLLERGGLRTAKEATLRYEGLKASLKTYCEANGIETKFLNEL